MFLILRCQQNITTISNQEQITIQSSRPTTGSETEERPLTWGPSFLHCNTTINPGSGESPTFSPQHTPSVREAGGLATGSTPKPQEFLPAQPGRTKEMDKDCGTAVPAQQPLGLHPLTREYFGHAVKEAILNRLAARGREGSISVS